MPGNTWKEEQTYKVQEIERVKASEAETTKNGYYSFRVTINNNPVYALWDRLYCYKHPLMLDLHK
jgi:hypothetical protein